MTTIQSRYFDTATPPSSQSKQLMAIKNASLLALLFGLLMFVPLIILGSAIGWPAILDEPASKVLPLIKNQFGAVFTGYLVYLLYSMLFFPTIASLVALGNESLVGRWASGFALISSLARSIGILRWLTVMPMLAGLFIDGQNQGTITLIYQAINSFGGGIGELLGVSLFGALAIAAAALHLRHAGVIPTWLAGFGWLAALVLLLPWLEALSINLGPIISLSVGLVQLWFLTLAVVLWFFGRSVQAGSV
jgi:hypothetical protein